MTLPWIIRCAALGVLAGPWIRSRVFASGTESGQPPRLACPACAARPCDRTRPSDTGWRTSWPACTPASPEAREQGWGGEIAGLEVSIAAAGQKPQAMDQLAARHQVTHLGMPDFRPSTGRSSGAAGGP